jgi:hypothetical protein
MRLSNGVQSERRFNGDVSHGSNSLYSRRKFLENSAIAIPAVAAGLYLDSRMPRVHGQSQPAPFNGRILIGQAVTPVDDPLNKGPISDDFTDVDTSLYKYPVYYTVPNSKSPEGYLRAKYSAESSSFVHFGIEIPSSTSNKEKAFALYYDTLNSHKTVGTKGTPGFYNLCILFPSATSFNEVAAIGSGDVVVGTPFSKNLGGKFTRGEDYDVGSYFGPSATYPFPHMNIRAKFRTDILFTQDPNTGKPIDEIGFGSDFIDTSGGGGLEFAWTKTRIKLLKDQVVSEPLGILGAAFAVGATAYATRKFSRRSFLGLPKRLLI